jgi:hypothetical protein
MELTLELTDLACIPGSLARETHDRARGIKERLDYLRIKVTAGKSDNLGRGLVGRPCLFVGRTLMRAS